MKTIMLLFAAVLFSALCPGNMRAFAQHGPGGPPGMAHGPSGNSHANSQSSSSGSHDHGSQGAVSSSPTEVLSKNSKLDSTLTMKLQSKNLLPAGTDLKTECSDFRNLGQCIAAIHVSHNLKVPFACLKADMTGQLPPAGSQCAPGTGSSKLSLGKSIQALDPNANSKQEAAEGTKDANSDLKEAESTS